jgi:hypothetical protein
MKYFLTPLVAAAFLLTAVPVASSATTSGQQVTNTEATLVAKKAKKTKKAKKSSTKKVAKK